MRICLCFCEKGFIELQFGDSEKQPGHIHQTRYLDKETNTRTHVKPKQLSINSTKKS